MQNKGSSHPNCRRQRPDALPSPSLSKGLLCHPLDAVLYLSSLVRQPSTPTCICYPTVLIPALTQSWEGESWKSFRLVRRHLSKQFPVLSGGCLETSHPAVEVQVDCWSRLNCFKSEEGTLSPSETHLDGSRTALSLLEFNQGILAFATCDWACPSADTGALWHTSDNDCTASLALPSCSALTQEVECSQHCPLGVGSLPAGNHAVCMQGCVATGTSRRCKWIPWLAYL